MFLFSKWNPIIHHNEIFRNLLIKLLISYLIHANSLQEYFFFDHLYNYKSNQEVSCWSELYKTIFQQVLFVQIHVAMAFIKNLKTLPRYKAKIQMALRICIGRYGWLS